MNNIRAQLLACILYGLCACQSSPAPEQPTKTNAPLKQVCPEPRPQICTMIYDPVCATRADGSRTLEASNCSACGDQDVVSYQQGPCTD